MTQHNVGALVVVQPGEQKSIAGIITERVQSLCAGDGEENENESEANSDLDSFAGDLENLLDAEEGEEGEYSHYESKHETVDGVKALKMRRCPFQTQAEEEIEDEAAEAAELCRMLMDGDQGKEIGEDPETQVENTEFNAVYPLNF